jgi:hypothetical protein
MTEPTRSEMLSDLASLGLKDYEKLPTATIQMVHDKYYPPIKLCEPITIRALKITPEQVDDALDAITKQEER